MICVFWLSTMKKYISLCNKNIKIRTKTTSFILWITSIGKVDLNIKSYNIIKKKIEKNDINKIKDKKNILNR